MLKIEELGSFRCPAFDVIPDIELYMDQVLSLTDKYFAPLCEDNGEGCITSSMINNYVKMKIVPPPEKKRYKREQIALIFMITVLKRVLSMNRIGELFVQLHEKHTTKEIYGIFEKEVNAAVSYISQVGHGAEGAFTMHCSGLYGPSLALKCAVDSFSNVVLSELLISSGTAKENA